jgi:hypothetical protein
MKYLKWFILQFFLFVIQPVFSQGKALFVGEIDGAILGSFKREEIILYPQFKFPPISTSEHRIEIRLYQWGFPMMHVICTIFTYDTSFSRNVYSIPFYPESGDKPEQIASSKTNLDSVFSEMVKAGIFSIRAVDRYEIKKSYHPMYVNSSGLDTTGTITVSDGPNYFLEFKVDKYYRQEIFDNPEAFSEYYRDNQMLRRQKEIVLAIWYGIKH